MIGSLVMLDAAKATAFLKSSGVLLDRFVSKRARLAFRGDDGHEFAALIVAVGDAFGLCSGPSCGMFLQLLDTLSLFFKLFSRSSAFSFVRLALRSTIKD